MFALDRLKVVMPLEHITVLNERVFTTTIRHGEILKLKYSQKVPSLLNIKIDYENSEAVIEFTVIELLEWIGDYEISFKHRGGHYVKPSEVHSVGVFIDR